MAKNIIEDVRPPRSIRNVPIIKDRKEANLNQNEREFGAPFQKHHPDDLEQIRHDDQREHRSGYTLEYKDTDFHNDSQGISPAFKYIIWLGILACIAGLFFVVSIFFTSATVTVTPKNETATILASLTAVKNGTNLDNSTPSAHYQLITLSDTATTSVATQGEQEVSQKASGQIVVYNTYSVTPQTLIKNTRFEASDGLIYRIQNQITIPGKTTSTPGSLSITVYADQPGPAYNIGLTDFTVPGLKSDSAKYNTIYARSKSPMTGGIQGLQAKISTSVQNSAQITLKAKLATELLTQAMAQTPNQYLFYAGAATTTYQAIPNTVFSSSSVDVVEQGTINAVVIERSSFASALAAKSLQDYDESPVDISNISQLNVNLVNLNSDTASLSVNGNAYFVWQYSTDKLANALKGKSSKDISSVLADFPSIAKADIVIRPFWISTLPSNPNKIDVVASSIVPSSN
jgi:hypothetical protein